MLEKNHEVFINEAKNKAVKSIKNFMTLLDINPDAYDFLYDIETELSYAMGNNIVALYHNRTNTISLNYIEILKYESRINKGEDREDVLLELSHDIIHEMIHAIRTITIENGLILAAPEIEMVKQKDPNLDQYYRLLDQTITKEYVKEFNTFIPIKVTMNSNNTYTVVAYNKKTNEFHIFNNQQFTTKLEEEDSLYKIGLELNDPNSKHKTNNIIKTFIPNDEEELNNTFSLGADQYYHPYSKGEKIIEPKELEEHNIKELIEKKRKLFKKKSEDAEGFEESITEAIALIIIIASNKKTLDLNYITDKINYMADRADVRVAANLLSRMGIDFIKWFLTSSFEDSYDNKTERIFKEKYDIILEKMNELYTETFADKPDEVLLDVLEDETNDTIDEIFRGMKR